MVNRTNKKFSMRTDYQVVTGKKTEQVWGGFAEKTVLEIRKKFCY